MAFSRGAARAMVMAQEQGQFWRRTLISSRVLAKEKDTDTQVTHTGQVSLPTHSAIKEFIGIC